MKSIDIALKIKSKPAEALKLLNLGPESEELIKQAISQKVDPVVFLQKQGKLSEEQLQQIVKLQNAKNDPLAVIQLVCKDEK